MHFLSAGVALVIPQNDAILHQNTKVAKLPGLMIVI